MVSRGEECAEEVDRNREIRDARRRRVPRRAIKPSRGSIRPAGIGRVRVRIHLRVELVFPPLIQRGRAGGGERGSEDGVGEREEIHRSAPPT